MIDVVLLALTRAWFATVVATGLLVAVLATERVWDGSVYWRGLPQAFELIGDTDPPPIIDRWN